MQSPRHNDDMHKKEENDAKEAAWDSNKWDSNKYLLSMSLLNVSVSLLYHEFLFG